MNSVIPPFQRPALLVASTGAPATFDVTAQWVACISASAEFLLSINDGPEFTCFQGFFLSFEDVAIQKVRAKVATGAAADNSVVLLFGVGEFRDARLAVAANTIVRSSSAATLSGAQADVTLAPATSTLLFPANANARLRRIRNAGTVDVRLATSITDTNAGRGSVLGPGEVGEYGVTGTIYAWCASGTPTLVRDEEVYS